MCRRKEAHLSRMMRFTLLSTSYGPINAIFSESLMYQTGEFRQDDYPIERFFLRKKGIRS
ncbi:hypothetical protein [Nitrosomonas sp.]|uniref:hypothetical protein n=1 Tax=Nitrosomonas sp. TaxID=42353 RepID=UPI0025F359C4|nr:hypothetical protein [Nitrosomonas sp.]